MNSRDRRTAHGCSDSASEAAVCYLVDALAETRDSSILRPTMEANKAAICAALVQGSAEIHGAELIADALDRLADAVTFLACGPRAHDHAQ